MHPGEKHVWEGQAGRPCAVDVLCGSPWSDSPASRSQWPGLHPPLRAVLSVTCDASSEPKCPSRHGSLAFPQQGDQPTEARRLAHPASTLAPVFATCAVRQRPVHSGPGVTRSVLPPSRGPCSNSKQASLPVLEPHGAVSSLMPGHCPQLARQRQCHGNQRHTGPHPTGSHSLHPVWRQWPRTEGRTGTVWPEDS